MDGIFKDKLFKHLTLVWIVILAILEITVNIVIGISFENVKKSYINGSYAILGRVSKNETIKKDKVAEVFTHGAKIEDYENGKNILAHYGYKEDMDIGLMPNINQIYKTLKIHISGIVLFSMILLYVITFLFYNKIITYVKMLNDGIKKVVEGDFSLRLPSIGEGHFFVLSHNFNQMAERLDNAIKELKKEKFFLKDTLSNISHQLKTPITSMILFNEALINDTSMAQEDIEKIGFAMANSLYRMEWLIKNLLKLAKIEGGAVEYNKIDNSFKKTIEMALEPLLIRIKDKNLKLQLNLAEGIYPHDKGWTSEALTNLIKNSIEHTKEFGKISISYENNSVYHKIIIRDDGEGIDKEDIPHIFEKFYRGKSSRTKKNDSIGIGLAFAKSIIEGQGGFIQAESIKGQGSKFTITFLTNL